MFFLGTSGEIQMKISGPFFDVFFLNLQKTLADC